MVNVDIIRTGSSLTTSISHLFDTGALHFEKYETVAVIQEQLGGLDAATGIHNDGNMYQSAGVHLAWQSGRLRAEKWYAILEL